MVVSVERNNTRVPEKPQPFYEKTWYPGQMRRKFKKPDGFVMLLTGFVAYVFIIIQFILR